MSWDLSSRRGHIRFHVWKTYNIITRANIRAAATTHNSKWEHFPWTVLSFICALRSGLVGLSVACSWILPLSMLMSIFPLLFQLAHYQNVIWAPLYGFNAKLVNQNFFVFNNVSGGILQYLNFINTATISMPIVFIPELQSGAATAKVPQFAILMFWFG